MGYGLGWVRGDSRSPGEWAVLVGTFPDPLLIMANIRHEVDIYNLIRWVAAAMRPFRFLLSLLKEILCHLQTLLTLSYVSKTVS